jgi:hypothetical protein
MRLVGSASAVGSGSNRCRWIAMHHGLSAAGNDHLHSVVQLVGERGRRLALFNDKRTWRTWALGAEKQLGLVASGRAGLP